MTYVYRHRQFGTLMVLVAAGVLVIGLILMRSLLVRGEKFAWLIVGLPLLITVLTLALFSALEITIDSQNLTWKFLPGFIKKSVPIAEVLEAQPVTSSFIYGWGIHYTDRGWLYNVSGLGAVHIKLRSGKQFMLGTDEPAVLAEAINRSRVLP